MYNLYNQSRKILNNYNPTLDYCQHKHFDQHIKIVVITKPILIGHFTQNTRRAHQVLDLKLNSMQTFSAIIKLIIWIKVVVSRIQLSCSHGKFCVWRVNDWTISKNLHYFQAIIKRGVVNPPIWTYTFNPSILWAVSSKSSNSNQAFSTKCMLKLFRATDFYVWKKIINMGWKQMWSVDQFSVLWSGRYFKTLTTSCKFYAVSAPLSVKEAPCCLCS